MPLFASYCCAAMTYLTTLARGLFGKTLSMIEMLAYLPTESWDAPDPLYEPATHCTERRDVVAQQVDATCTIQQREEVVRPPSYVEQVITRMTDDPKCTHENIHSERIANAVREFEENGTIAFHPKMRVSDVRDLCRYFQAYKNLSAA